MERHRKWSCQLLTASAPSSDDASQNLHATAAVDTATASSYAASARGHFWGLWFSQLSWSPTISGELLSSEVCREVCDEAETTYLSLVHALGNLTLTVTWNKEGGLLRVVITEFTYHDRFLLKHAVGFRSCIMLETSTKMLFAFLFGVWLHRFCAPFKLFFICHSQTSALRTDITRNVW